MHNGKYEKTRDGKFTAASFKTRRRFHFVRIVRLRSEQPLAAPTKTCTFLVGGYGIRPIKNVYNAFIRNTDFV